MKLAGKVTAITGAGLGIGRAAALLFAQEGATVVIIELSEDSGREVERAISEAGGRAHFIRTDVADAASVAAAFAEIDQRFGCLDVLYNNASIYLGDKDGPLADVALETWRRVLSINLDGLFHCTQRALPLLLRQGGSIINTGSSASQIGIPNCDAYTASKGATVALTGPNFTPSEDSLTFTNQLGITGTYNSGTGVLTLTGTRSLANYQTALRSVRYANSSDTPLTSK